MKVEREHVIHPSIVISLSLEEARLLSKEIDTLAKRGPVTVRVRDFLAEWFKRG